jgi:prophage DNA circulation protein
MAIRFASKLHRNRHGVLYFRIKVQLDIQDHFPAKEIYRSLKTANIREASDTAQGLSILFKRAFKELRRNCMLNRINPTQDITAETAAVTKVITAFAKTTPADKKIERFADSLLN